MNRSPFPYELLACPHCGGDLSVLVCKDASTGQDNGVLSCGPCEWLWSVHEGIPRFVNAGNIDLHVDKERLRALPIDETGITQAIVNANVARLETWIDGQSGWDRQEMELWEEYYSRKRKDKSDRRIATFNRLIPRQRHILRQIPGDATTVLEVGCGNAGTLIRDREFIAGKRYFGTDLSFEALKAAREKLPGHYVLCDATALPFQRGLFDAIIGFGVLHHLTCHEEALTHLSQFLRPGGWLGFAEKLKTSEKIRNSRSIALAKRLLLSKQQSREHGGDEYVDNGRLLELLSEISSEPPVLHYEYSVMRDVLVKLLVDKLHVNTAGTAKAIIWIDQACIRLLAPVSDLFLPKHVLFVAQKMK